MKTATVTCYPGHPWDEHNPARRVLTLDEAEHITSPKTPLDWLAAEGFRSLSGRPDARFEIVRDSDGWLLAHGRQPGQLRRGVKIAREILSEEGAG